jgi:hypothetical protein
MLEKPKKCLKLEHLLKVFQCEYLKNLETGTLNKSVPDYLYTLEHYLKVLWKIFQTRKEKKSIPKNCSEGVDRTSEKVEKNGEKISVKNKVAKRVN